MTIKNKTMRVTEKEYKLINLLRESRTVGNIPLSILISNALEETAKDKFKAYQDLKDDDDQFYRDLAERNRLKGVVLLEVSRLF